MSVRITTDVFCDECGRWATFGTDDRAHVKAAQQGARKHGWTFKRNGDCACPECNGKTQRGGYWGFGLTDTPQLPGGF